MKNIRPLKIGIVANSAFNIYNYRLGLIHELQEQGHHVVAIAPKDKYTSYIEDKKIEFIEVNTLARKGTNPLGDFKLMNEFRNIYKTHQLDIVLQYTIKPNIYGTLAAKLNGTKSICTVTGLGYTFLNNSIASKVAFRLYRLAFSFADKVLFQNTDDEQTFLYNKLVSKSKTGIIPGSGIDTHHFHPDFCTAKTDTKIRFLMIGRLLKDKGVYEYVESAKQLSFSHPDIEFHLIGEIDNQNPSAILKRELEEWIKNGQVKFHDHVKDIRPIICASDCVVLPSYREGMPRAILEGMAMGKPCITTDAPGCKDVLIDMESGFLCRTADATSLRLSMEKFILLSEEEKVNFGQNARKRAESKFSSNAIYKIYVDLVRNLSEF